jgi:RNA-binding protein
LITINKKAENKGKIAMCILPWQMEKDMTSKQRAYLKGLAMNIEPIFQIGKSSLTPEVTEAVSEAFNTRELIKITVLKNCLDDPKAIAQALAERTRSQVVQVIGKKIVLYKENKDHKKIELPK